MHGFKPVFNTFRRQHINHCLILLCMRRHCVKISPELGRGLSTMMGKLLQRSVSMTCVYIRLCVRHFFSAFKNIYFHSFNFIRAALFSPHSVNGNTHSHSGIQWQWCCCQMIHTMNMFMSLCRAIYIHILAFVTNLARMGTIIASFFSLLLLMCSVGWIHEIA